MQCLALWAAAGFSLVCWSVHTFVGGRLIARPLVRSDLAAVPRLTSYYCWHIVTIVLAALPAAYAYAALVPSGRDVAVLATALAGSFLVWSLTLVVWKRRRPFELPQWALFLPVTAAGVLGVL